MRIVMFAMLRTCLCSDSLAIACVGGEYSDGAIL